MAAAAAGGAAPLHEPLLAPAQQQQQQPLSDSFARYLRDVQLSESTNGMRPRLLYEQRRLQVCLPPLATMALAATFVAFGLALALPDSDLATAVLQHTTWRRHNTVQLGLALFLLGLLLAPMCLWISMCLVTPSRKRRQREAVIQDAMLEELLAGASLGQHYDVVQPAAAAAAGSPALAPATVLFLAGAGAPRLVSRQLAEALACLPPPPCSPADAEPPSVCGFKAVCVDLPGHGSLLPIGFNLARCERVLTAVIQRELQHTRAAAAKHAAAAAAAAAAADGPSLLLPVSMQQQQQQQPTPPATPGSRRFEAAGGVPPTTAAIDFNDDEQVAEAIGAAAAAAPLDAVVLVAFGASSCVAAHFAARHPALVAGVVMLGRGPPRHTMRRAWFSCCSVTRAYSGALWPGAAAAAAAPAGGGAPAGLDGGTPASERRSACGPGNLYRLRWAAALVNIGIKSRVQANSHAPDELKAALLANDFHVGVLPEYLAALGSTGHALGHALRTLALPVLVLAPVAAADEVRDALPRNGYIEVVPAKGVKHPCLPTLNPAKVAALADAVAGFVPPAFSAAGYRQVYRAAMAAQQAGQAAAAAADGGRRSDSLDAGTGGGGGGGGGGRSSSSGARGTGSGFTGSFATRSGSVSASADRRRHMSRRGLSVGGYTTTGSVSGSLGGESLRGGGGAGGLAGMARFLGRRSPGAGHSQSSFDEVDAYAAASLPSSSAYDGLPLAAGSLPATPVPWPRQLEAGASHEAV